MSTASTMVVGIRFEADTADMTAGNRKIINSLTEIKSSLVGMTSRFADNAKASIRGAEEIVKAHRSTNEAIKSQVGATEKLGDSFRNLQQQSSVALKGQVDSINKLGNSFGALQQQSSKNFSKIKSDLGSFSQSVKSSLSNIITSFGQFSFNLQNAASMINNLSAPMKQVVEIGAGFEAKMSTIGAVSDATDTQLAGLGTAMRDLAKASVFSANEVGDAGINLARAGFSIEETMSALPGVLALAASSGESLATASAIAAEQLRAFKLETKESTMVADLFSKAANASNVGVAELGESMKYSSPIFAAANQSILTLTTATSLLANISIHGSQSGTSLRMAMLRLAAPTNKAAEEMANLSTETGTAMTQVEAMKTLDEAGSAMKRLGIQVSDSKGKIRDFGDILADFYKASEKMADADRLDMVKTVFGTEASSAMLELISQSKEFNKTIIENGQAVTVTTTAFKEFRKKLDDNKGFAEITSKKMLNNLKGDWNQFTGNLEELALSVFDMIGPTLRQLVQLSIQGLQSIILAVQAITPTVAALKEGFLAGIEPIGLALSSLFDALTPVKVAFEALSQEWGGVAESGKQSADTFEIIKASAYALGVVLGKIVSVGIVPLVQGLIFISPAINTVVTGVVSLTSSVISLGKQLTGVFTNFKFDGLTQLSSVFSLDLSSSGQALVTTFVSGIKSAGQTIYYSIFDFFKFTDRLFPHSNAQAGPFSALYESGQSLILTFTAGLLSVGDSLTASIHSIFAKANTNFSFSLIDTSSLDSSIAKIKESLAVAIDFFSQLDTSQKIVISSLTASLVLVSSGAITGTFVSALVSASIHSQKFIAVLNTLRIAALSVGVFMLELYNARVIPIVNKLVSVWPKVSYVIRNFWDEATEAGVIYWATMSKSFSTSILTPFLEKLSLLKPIFTGIGESVTAIGVKIKGVFISFQEATQGMNFKEKIEYLYNSLKSLDFKSIASGMTQKIGNALSSIAGQIATLLPSESSMIVSFFKETIPGAINSSKAQFNHLFKEVIPSAINYSKSLLDDFVKSFASNSQGAMDTLIKATAINSSAFIALGQSLGIVKEEVTKVKEVTDDVGPIFTEEQLKFMHTFGNELINIALITASKYGFAIAAIYNGVKVVWAFKQELVDAAKGVIGWFNQLDETSRMAITAIAGVSAFIPILLTLAPLLLKAANPLTLFLSFIPSILGALANYKDEVNKFIEDVKKNGISELGRALGDLISLGLSKIFGDNQIAKSVATSITSGLEWAFQQVENLGAPAVTVFAGALAAAVSFAVSKALTGAIAKSFAKKPPTAPCAPCGLPIPQQAPPVPTPPSPPTGGRQATEAVSIWRRAWNAISGYAMEKISALWTALKNSSAVQAMQGTLQRMWVVASAYPIRMWESFKLSAKVAIAEAGLYLQRSMTVAGATFVNLWNTAWLKFKAMGTAAVTGFMPMMRSLWTSSMTHIPVLWTAFSQRAAVVTSATSGVLQRMFVTASIGGAMLWQGFKTTALATISTTSVFLSSSYQRLAPWSVSLWTTFKQQAIAATTTSAGLIQRSWVAGSVLASNVWSGFLTQAASKTAGARELVGRVFIASQAHAIAIWTTFKTAASSALLTTGGLLNRSLTVASVHTSQLWTRFTGVASTAISPVSGFIGRAFTVASAHTSQFWARFRTEGEVATATTGSRLGGMFSKKTAMIGAITAGTVATTMFSSQDAAASELGNTPKVNVDETQGQLQSAFSLTKIKEQWSQDLTEMLDKFGLLKPIGDAITYTMENMETVGMGAMLVLSTGLLDLGMAFTVLKTGAAALGAFFIGWQIGTYLYNQFAVVQETAIAVVGWFVEMGQGISNAVGTAINAVANFRFADFANSLLSSIRDLPAGLSQITTSLNEVWHGLGDVLMAPARILGDLGQIMGTMIGEVTGALSSGNWGDAGMSIITGIVKGVWSVASNVSSAILGIAKMAISAILPESWYQAGADLLSAFGGGIASAAKSVWDAVLGAFNWVWNLFPHSDANEGPFAQLTTSGQGLMTAFVNGVLSLPTLLLDAITGIFTGVTTYLESIIYSDRGAAIMMSIKDGILSLPTLLVDGITTLFTSVSTYLESIVYSDRGVAIITSIRDGILSAPTLIIDSVRQVFDSVMQYITTIDFTEAGRKLLSTVGDGIKQGAQELTSAVSDGLTSVRQYLPFSDAKTGPLSDLTASGQSIPATLATGVTQNSATLTTAVADMTQQGSGAMGALETAASETAASVKATAIEATQSLQEAEEKLRASKEKLFELSQKKSLTTSRTEKKEITKEEVGVRQEVHDAQEVVRQLRESTKEQTAIQKAAAKEAEKATKDANKAIKESHKEAARDMKESLYDQADALTNVSKQYKEAAKSTEEFADKLKRTYETLSYTRNELSMSSMNDMQKGIFQNVNDYGADYGQQLAQVKMLTSANQELTAAKNELAKAGMSESQARLFDLQQKYTSNVAFEIFQTQELTKTKKALHEESLKSRESQLVDNQKEYVDLMKQVGVEEGKRIILQRQALSNQTKLKQESASYWDSMSDKAGEYYEKFATGQMSAKQSLKGFFGSILEEQKKAALEKGKQAFLGLFGLSKGTNQDSQVQRDLDKATQFMKQSNDGVVSAGKDMAGTISKAVEDAGKNLSTSVDNLGKQVNDTIQKAADLTKNAEGLENAANQLKESASDISITRAGNDAVTSPSPTSGRSEPLGYISAKYESGGRGVETVSSGKGDRGGVSYGAHQLASLTGTMQEYLDSVEGSAYKALFAGMKAGSAEFSAKYKEIAKNDAANFAASQEAYIKRTHYEPILKYAADKQSKLLDTSNTAMQEALYSMGVQHRGHTKAIIDRYLKANQGKELDIAGQLKGLYESRAVQVGRNKGLMNRYERELNDILKLVNDSAQESKQITEASKTIVSTASVNPSPVGKGMLDSLSESTAKAMQGHVSYFINTGKQAIANYSKPTNMEKLLEVGKIDCSGWVSIITKTAFEKINKEAGQVVFDKADMKLLQDSSHNIIQNIADKTGTLIDNRKTSNFGSQLKEGMMVGLDKGDHGWDQGRVRAGSAIDKNIDHIVQVTVDKVTGKLGISESHSVKQGGKQVGGVMWTELDKWLEQNKKATMFAVDPFKLAAKDMQTVLTDVTKTSKTATDATQEMQSALGETAEASQKASKAIKEVIQADNENASKAEKLATVRSNVAKASADQTAQAMLSDSTLNVNTSLKGQVQNTGKLDMSGDKAFVVHHTATMGSAKGVVDILKQRGLGVQYVIDRDGTVVQLLDEKLKASHVGKTELKKNITNANAVGVEIVGGYDNAITPAQMASALKLAKSLGFNKEEVMGHGELTGRKRFTEGMSATEYAKANWDKVGKIDVKAINEPLQNTGKALSQVAKVASEAATATATSVGDQAAAAKDVQAVFEARLKNEAEAANMTAALAEAKKTEQAALSGLTDATIQQKQTELVNAQSYEQAMAAVEATRLASATQDATAMVTHAGSAQTASENIVQTTDDATKQVADMAGKASDGLANAAGQCLAEVTDNPVIQNAADLKEATEVMTDNCQGKSEGIMGMFSGLGDKISGMFGGIGEKLSGLFSGGGKEGGFLSSITSGLGSLFGGGKEGGGFMSTITKGIGSLFGGGKEGGGGFMDTITKGIGGLFGGGGGKEGGIMSTIGNLFSGKGDMMGTLTKGLGGLMGGTEEAGKFISGLTSNLGNLTGSMGEVGKGISSLLGGGGGSTPGMGALSVGMSLLSGDMAGAAQGAAQLLGSMTPLGPIGGMIAGKLVALSGIGAKWVREAEWVEVSMKGMTASFSKGYRETKKGWIGGGSRTKSEDLDEATVKKLSDMLGETKKSIEAVSDSLSMGKDGLLGKMDNFRYHIAAMENKGPEWFDKAFETMRVAMVKSAVDNIMIAGEDVKTNLGGNFKNTFKQVLDGTFNEAARAETWDGVLTKFVASADTAIKGGLQDNVSTQLGERLTEFVNSSADQFKNMPIDQLQGALTGEIGKIFTDITGVAIPESISGELAEVFATRIQDAVKLASGEEVSGATVITDKGEAGFYKTLKGMVGSFEGTEQELTTFISKMMEVKDIFKQTGLDMTIVSEDLVKGFGDIEKFSSSMAFFKDNFASASGTNIEFTNSLSGLNKSLKEIHGSTLPGINTAFPTTREEFYKLTQSVSKLGKDGEETFTALIKGAPQFANYYKAIEDFNQKFGGSSGTTLKAQAKKATDLNKTLNDSFKGLGIELPKTRKGLFDLAQGFDLTNESQRKLHDSILELTPALDELFTNNEQVDKFRDSMRGIYDSAGGAEKTISDLSKQFPELNLGASAMTLNTKEAARSLANMSDGELMAWAESMGLTGLSIEDITQKTTDYLTAATELQNNIGSFKDEMHKIATGATDNEAAMSKLVDKYPMLSDSLTQAGVTATEVASYFDQMSPDQLKALADSLGVTVDTLMADTQTYIGILQSQSDMFKSINGESLGGDLMKVMTDANVTSAKEAGKMFGDNFVSQFESQMVSTVLNSVMQTIYQGVVEPFLTSSAQAAMNITEGGAMAGSNLAEGSTIAGSNLTEGSAMAGSNIVQGSTSAATTSATGGQMAATAMATGGMLAGDALAKIVEDAKQKIIVMGQVMAELKSSGVFDQITSSLSSVGETAYGTFGETLNKNKGEVSSGTSEPNSIGNPDAEDWGKDRHFSGGRGGEGKRSEETSSGEVSDTQKEDAAESQKAAEDAKKAFTDFNKSLSDLSGGLEGNTKTINDLKTTYKDATVTQLLATSSSKDMVTQLQGLSQTQLEGIAKAAGVEVSKLTGDLLGLVDMTKQSEKAMGDFRNKMAITAGTTTEYGQTITRLRNEYPELTSVFNDQGLSSKELATQLSTMDDGQIKSIAASLGVTTDQFMADSEAYIGALKSQEEALKSQQESLKSFRDSLEEIANPNQGKQKTIGDLDKEFAGLGLAAKAMTLDTAAAAKAMLSMPDDQLIAFAEQYGLTTDQLKEKTVAYFGAVNELQQGMETWRGKMTQMVTGESEATTTVKSLSQKSPYLTEITQGMDSKGMAKLFSGMDNTQIEALANQYGVSIEKFEADTEAWVNSTKTIEEETRNLAQGFVDFRTKMGQIATGTTDAQESISKLSNTYGGFSEVQGKSSKELATYFSTLSDADITAMATRFGVSTDQFKTDAETFVSSTQSMEEVTKSQAESMKEFRDSLLLASGAITENELSIKNLSDKYPSLSGILNDSSITAKEAAERFNSLSDDELRALATSLGTDFDTLKADAGTWLGILKQQDDGLKESTKAIGDFQNEMRKTAGAANDSQITMEGLTAKYPALSSAINDSSITAESAASQFASMDMQSLADQLGIPVEELIADSQAWVGALAANDEAIKANQEAMAGYRDTMLKATGTYGDSDIALRNLTASYPTFASTINSTSMSAKDAATYFSSLSDTEFEELAKSLGKTTEQLRTDSTEWVNTMAANDEAIKANQEAMASYYDTMLKATGTYGDSNIALKNLSASYPTLASTINSTSMSAKDAATYFSQLSDTEFEELAKSLGKTTDQLRTDSTEWVNTIAANQESFNSFNESMVKLKGGVTDNDLTLQKLASQYPSLSAQILKSGQTAEQAASQFANMSETDLDTMAASLGVTTDKLKEDIQAFTSALPSGQVFKDLRTGLEDLINPLQGAEKTIDDLAKKYPNLNLATNALGINVTDAATAIQGMTDNDMAAWAEANKIAPEEAKEATLAYLGAVKELQGQIGSFKDKMHQLATGMTDNEATIERLKKQYPSLADSLSKSGMTAQDVAKQFDSMSSQQIADMAKSLGVSVETFTADVEAYTGVLTAQAEETKAKAEQLASFRTEMTKLGGVLSESELTINNLTSKFPSLVDSLKGLGTNSKDVANQLAKLDDSQLEDLAKVSKVTTDQFLENAQTYINTLASQEVETKAAIQSVQGMQDGFKKLTSGMKDSEYTVNQLGSKYPNLISSMGLSGKTAKEVASQFATMDPARVVEMAKSLGVSTDDFVSDIGGYVSALQSMAEEAKAITDSLNGFRGEMDRMASSMTDYDYTISNLSKTVPNLTNKLTGLGSSSQAIAGSLSRMNADQLEAMAKQAGLSVDEFINNSKSYVDAMKSREASIEEEQKKAQEEAQKQADDAAEKAKQEAEKVQADLMKQVDKFFDVFGKLADKLGAVSESIASDIQSFDTQEENATAARRNAQMQALQKSLNDFKGIDLAKEVDKDSAKESEKAIANIEKYRKLLMEESKFRIDAVTKEKDAVLKTHDEIIAGFTKLKEGVAGIMNAIADDITALDAELGKGGKKTALKEKTSGEYATAMATFQSSMANNTVARTEIGKVAEIDTTKLQGVSATDLQQSSQSLMAISEANIAILKQGQENSKQAIADGEKLVKLGEEYRKGINDALREQLADLDKANEEVSKQLEKTQEETIKRLETERDEKIKAAEKSRDDTIKALETERDTKIKHLEEVQEAAKKLQETLTKVKDAVASLQDAVKTDMEKLAKDMALPGTTAIEKLNAMQGQIKGNLPVTEESVKKLETYKGLILESLQEQIDLENQRFEKEKEAEAKQLDHYNKLIDFSKQLKGFLDDLKLGELTTYNPTERLAEARRQYEETLRLAKSGDEEAMGQVTAKAQGYLKEAQGYYASSDEYTGIFKDVNANIGDLKGVAEAEADRIARELPLDKTGTAKNVANILPLQQAALDKLQGVNGLLTSMGMDVATQLTSPAATPMPDDQFSSMLEKEKENFTTLIESQKTDTDKLVETLKTDTEKSIETLKANTEKSIADNKVNTEAEGNKLRELAKTELQALNTSLGGIETQLKTASEEAFDDTDFANNVTALQQASVGQLVQLGNYVIAMDAGLKDSLKTNIDGLMSQLSPENQLIVAERLDEAMQRNITGPLYELIGAVKGESVKKELAKKEKDFTDNQTALNHALENFNRYRELAKDTGINLSFEEFMDKLSPLVTAKFSAGVATGGTFLRTMTGGVDNEGIKKVFESLGADASKYSTGLNRLNEIVTTFLTDQEDVKFANTWGEFKSSYLQSNKDLQMAFGSKQDEQKASELARFKILSDLLSKFDAGLANMRSADVNKGKTTEELVNTAIANDTQYRANAKFRADAMGVSLEKIDTYDDFKNAKATLEELRKSLIGVTSLKGELDGLNSKLVTTKTELPKLDFSSLSGGLSKESKMPDLFSYLPTSSAPSTTPSAIGSANTAATTARGGLGTAAIQVGGNVSASGAKDIIIKLDNVFTQWRDLTQGYRKDDLKDYEKRFKEETELKFKQREEDIQSRDYVLELESQRWASWRAEELAWRLEDVAAVTVRDAVADAVALARRTEDVTTAFTWRDEDMKFRQAQTELHNTEWIQIKERELAFHNELVETIKGISISVQQASAPKEEGGEGTEMDTKDKGKLPSFDVGTPYVKEDMRADIHKGEIIVDPASADFVRKYGIRVQATPAQQNQSNGEVAALLNTLIQEVRILNASSGRGNSDVKQAIVNLETTVGLPVVNAIKRTGQATMVRK